MPCISVSFPQTRSRLTPRLVCVDMINIPPKNIITSQNIGIRFLTAFFFGVLSERDLNMPNVPVNKLKHYQVHFHYEQSFYIRLTF